MIPIIKSEFRKLFSVRSTYVIMIITMLFLALMSFYLEGYWGQTGSAAASLQPSAISEIMRNSLGMIAMFVSIIAILQVGHEYRHNTIFYTLTASPSRTKVFLSKIIVISGFTIGFGLLALSGSVLLYMFGLALRGVSLPPQEINLLVQIPRFVFYLLIYAMLGMFLTLIVRNLIGAIVIMLVYPTTVEPLAGLLLKGKGAYLPVSTFDHVIGVALQPNGVLTPNRATLLSLLYISLLGVVAWILFIKRDAN